MKFLTPSRPHLCNLTLASLLACAIAAVMSACSTPPTAQPDVSNSQEKSAAVSPPPTPVAAQRLSSQAQTPQEYRQDAAEHLYKLNHSRIFKGRLPPMLYAVGVLDVELNRDGQVLATHWKRAPMHAPEVMAEIEKTVRAAAPYPAPSLLGTVIYTDVWLWHQSGLFQLDTLTEGQD